MQAVAAQYASCLQLSVRIRNSIALCGSCIGPSWVRTQGDVVEGIRQAIRCKDDIAVWPPYEPESLSKCWPLWPAGECGADKVTQNQGLERPQLLPDCFARSAALLEQVLQGRCTPRLEDIEGLVHPCVCALVSVAPATADAVCKAAQQATHLLHDGRRCYLGSIFEHKQPETRRLGAY